MRLLTQAIVVAVRQHGEHGAIVRALTPSDGVQPGFVRGGRSRRLRPVLVPGNLIQAEYRARTDEQLAQLTVELTRSRAHLFSEALAAAGIDWACAMTAAALPEAQAYPRVYEALDGLLAAIEAAPSARGWSAALVRYELLLLAQLGFGLDLTECAATGAREDLSFVSPNSGRAVSAGGAGEYRDRLLPLPPFLLGGEGAPGWGDIGDGLRLTGHFLARDLLTERRADVLAARERLVDRLKRIGSSTMDRTIVWRLHTASPPKQIWALLTTDEGRERFWVERSRSDGTTFELTFGMGVTGESLIRESVEPSLFAFSYFGTEVRIELESDGSGGTDLTLTNSAVPEEEYEDMLPGWLNVLLPLKAAADFGVDLRNHDPARTWRERYVDQ